MKPTVYARVSRIFLMAVILLAGNTLATEMTAWQLQFQAGLGKPLIAWCHFYAPFDFIRWVVAYAGQKALQPYFNMGYVVLGLTVISIMLLALYYNVYEWRHGQHSDTYGSARFATVAEIKQSHLWRNDDPFAVIVGGYQHSNALHYLKDSSPSHVFVYAPSRSGKGVGLIVPTLLTYQGSVIVSDFKLENWALTAGARRSLGQKVIKFDPTCTDGTAAGFNPLLEIRQGEYEVRDTQLIADALVNPTGKDKLDHWANAANSLLVATILHVLYAEEDKSLAGVHNFLSEPKRTETETLERMLTAVHDPHQKQCWGGNHNSATGAEQFLVTHPVVSHGAREMLNKSEAERSGVFSTALTFLKLYRDPLVARHSQRHDFTIADLTQGKKPVSLYLGIPPSDIERLMPLMRLMVQLIVSRLTEKLYVVGNTAQRHPLLLMLDEFPQFGRLPFFEKALGYAAGYGIRAYLISQDIQQIYKEYTKEQSIISNCGIRIAYAPNTLETAKHLSEALGVSTVQRKQRTWAGNRLNILLPRLTESQLESKRALMTPDELLRLPDERALIFKNGMAPIAGHKLYYYRDQFYAERSAIFAPRISDRFRHKIKWLRLEPKKVILKPVESLLPDEQEPDKTKVSYREGDIFIKWLHKKLIENYYTINQVDSYVHRVERGILIIAKSLLSDFLHDHPHLVERSLTTPRNIDNWMRRFSKTSRFDKKVHYYREPYSEDNKISGFIVPVACVFDEPWPPINTQLKIDISKD